MNLHVRLLVSLKGRGRYNFHTPIGNLNLGIAGGGGEEDPTSPGQKPRPRPHQGGGCCRLSEILTLD